jgi:predicted nucleotidyltransferase
LIAGWVVRKQEALTLLANHQKTLKDFGVKSLVLFGSVARDEARTDSDVDLLVEFDRPVGLFTFVRLKRYLEQILESSVDLGTPDSLKPYLQESVFREAVRAF